MFKVVPMIAQSGGCATVFSLNQKNSEALVNITEGKPTQSVPKVNKTLSIKVYVVRSHLKVYGVTDGDIQTAINALNQYFTPIALTFTKCAATQYIENYQLENISHTYNQGQMLIIPDAVEKELLTLFNEINIINLYLVNDITDSQGKSACGFTYMPADGGKNAIFVKKECFLDGSTLAHQMGHFLNLYHTHEDMIGTGAEKVDETNCTTAGDRCCDTEADPNLDGNVNTDCVYTGLIKYNNTDLYHPSPKNLMSFSNANCRCVFSRTQYLRMIDALTRLRPYLH
jgi:hypothetical protein